MLKRWEKKLDLYAPLQQAGRCLDQWLKEEGKTLSPVQKERTAALLARYFQHEDELSDQLILSFLRHYSGRSDVDMEDPTSVRLEIKSALDLATAAPSAAIVRRPVVSFAIGVLLVLLCFGVWEMATRKITLSQQAQLRDMVREVTLLDPVATPASVWAEVKGPLQVRSYQDIPWWRFSQSRDILDARLVALRQTTQTASAP